MRIAQKPDAISSAPAFSFHFVWTAASLFPRNPIKIYGDPLPAFPPFPSRTLIISQQLGLAQGDPHPLGLSSTGLHCPSLLLILDSPGALARWLAAEALSFSARGTISPPLDAYTLPSYSTQLPGKRGVR